MESQTVKGIEKDLKSTQKQIKSEFGKAKAKISEAQHYAEDYIAKNPKKATAIAIGVGAAIGAAITAYWVKEKDSQNETHDAHEALDDKERAVEQG